MISLQHVNARAGDFALADVSFEVPQGAYGVVIGPAGAGKTTLLETIAGVIRVTSGKIVLGGEDMTHAPPERAARGHRVSARISVSASHRSRRTSSMARRAPPSSTTCVDRFGVDALAQRSGRRR